MTYEEKNPFSPHTLYRHIHDIYVFMDITDAELFSRFELTTLQYNALSILERDGEQQFVTLANRLLVTRSTVTRMIDDMETKGWVQRIDDPQDRRAFLVSLTDNGRDLWRQAHAAHQQSLEQRFAALSDADQQTLITLLHTVRAATHEIALQTQAK
jgi:DNA-binding MarR family transcriptional regulator